MRLWSCAPRRWPPPRCSSTARCAARQGGGPSVGWAAAGGRRAAGTGGPVSRVQELLVARPAACSSTLCLGASSCCCRPCCPPRRCPRRTGPPASQVQLLGATLSIGRPSGYVDPGKAAAAAVVAAEALARFQVGLAAQALPAGQAGQAAWGWGGVAEAAGAAAWVHGEGVGSGRCVPPGGAAGPSCGRVDEGTHACPGCRTFLPGHRWHAPPSCPPAMSALPCSPLCVKVPLSLYAAPAG